MNKKTVAAYCAAFVYEIIKVFYIAVFSSNSLQETAFSRYSALAALCVPVLLWLMLALNEKAFHWALYAAALFKLTSICAEFLYIFRREFAIIGIAFASAQISSGFDFSKEVLFFLAADTVLLFYSFIKGSVYYANNTDC
ncbi:hypothetical protein E4N71_02660 [Treponema vincentii]|jgi:hypothetical protein|uniref:hypothetical protein n=1 Tax=Treponema vincentii TaxID=69710 RepID=UPI0020A5D02A|nr:hypothetical protein [Treponema vincentii]UTC46589.1 hypothetical protein E4N72_08465 [Treponema vincentii]UTC48963.1 hypothetical protein E4N73_09000 [Treponema vincentii]UTC59436.1 hypothetical protein E4N70_08255 [Treponema vincentii]